VVILLLRCVNGGGNFRTKRRNAFTGHNLACEE